MSGLAVSGKLKPGDMVLYRHDPELWVPAIIERVRKSGESAELSFLRVAKWYFTVSKEGDRVGDYKRIETTDSKFNSSDVLHNTKNRDSKLPTGLNKS